MKKRSKLKKIQNKSTMMKFKKDNWKEKKK